jgi:hypothetical protein
MKKNFYKCNGCERKFGRKWNALRHSRSIHSSASDIISNNIRPKTSYISNNKYIRYQKKFDILNKAGIEIYNEYDENMSDIFDIDEKDFKIIKIIDQLIKPFTELEDLLSRTDPKTRAFVLTRSFDQSLRSPNPVEAMNEMVELLCSINGIKKIAKYRSMIATTSSLDPILGTKEKIKNSYLFGRQNN